MSIFFCGYSIFFCFFFFISLSLSTSKMAEYFGIFSPLLIDPYISFFALVVVVVAPFPPISIFFFLLLLLFSNYYSSSSSVYSPKLWPTNWDPDGFLVSFSSFPFALHLSRGMDSPPPFSFAFFFILPHRPFFCFLFFFFPGCLQRTACKIGILLSSSFLAFVAFYHHHRTSAPMAISLVSFSNPPLLIANERKSKKLHSASS